MKQIKLTRGKFAIVDDEDFEELAKHKWNCQITKTEGRNYAYRVGVRPDGGKTTVRMHRQIIGESAKGMDIDHIDGDGLNNQKSNLRPCTRSQNNGNARMPRNNKSGFKGVSFDKNRGLWVAQADGKHAGRHTSKEDAARAYNKKAFEIWGEFARLNDI